MLLVGFRALSYLEDHVAGHSSGREQISGVSGGSRSDREQSALYVLAQIKLLLVPGSSGRRYLFPEHREGVSSCL
jgi:hypothetical protein